MLIAGLQLGISTLNSLSLLPGGRKTLNIVSVDYIVTGAVEGKVCIDYSDSPNI
jgi:hypothetical protein